MKIPPHGNSINCLQKHNTIKTVSLYQEVTKPPYVLYKVNKMNIKEGEAL
jgi:hypothetical protein